MKNKNQKKVTYAPDFNFDEYNLTEGEVFKEYSNYCLTHKSGNPFHIIWLDRNGIIIDKSLEYVRLIKETNDP